jgi:hypothetical protein
MPLDPDAAEARRADTRDAAAAFLEDSDHARALLSGSKAAQNGTSLAHVLQLSGGVGESITTRTGVLGAAARAITRTSRTAECAPAPPKSRRVARP